MNTLKRLQIEKNNLESALKDFTQSLKLCHENSTRSTLIQHMTIIQCRLEEFNRVLSILNIKL